LSALDRGEAQTYKQYLEGKTETANADRHARISAAYAAGQFGMTADDVDEFMQAFARLQNETKLRVGAPAPDVFHDLVAKAEASPHDMMYLAMMLIQTRDSSSEKYWGSKLMFMLAAAGYVEASIRIVNNTLIEAKHRPGLLRQAAVAVERGRIQKHLREQDNSRAMVLEGKVAYHLGDADTAIKWWWKAVEGAQAKSKEMMARRAAGLSIEAGDMSGIDRSDLSTPWIELIEAHFERSLTQGKNEWDLCEKAINIGVDEDDPTAFYYAATYNKKRHEDGSHMPTSEWLYYMSKAAASGVTKAAYELGVYYAESGWKYIEDEPPEHLKPTPFDTYPADSAASGSPWDLVKKLFSPAQATTDKDNIFHSAIWPSKPEERYKLAIQWLEIAAAHSFAPAYLYLAKLYIQETLWAGAQAPEEALEMSPKRYLYASKNEQLDAHFTGDVKTPEIPADAIDPPNPFHSVNKAKANLVEVFVARHAVVARETMLRELSKDRRDLEWEDVMRDRMSSHPHLERYMNNQEVFGQWEKESKGMHAEAAAICEQMGWTIYDDRGGLWYKVGVGAIDKDVVIREVYD